uniref:Uncharacterized protein n=1 Tax=Vitis vinifera TaxID=29760 RepID=A5BCT5_VITVI|nr:hypothetical protein VITISV_003158 [Vitis vinifera]
MDDIKETVRNSGDKLCRAVASLTTRLCDVSLTGTSDAKQAMDIVLPFLLAEGIMSKVNNISKASIAIVMKLAKTMPWRVKANKEQAREYLETRNLQVYYQRKLYKMLDLKCLSTLNSKVLWPNEASTYL